MPRRTTTPEQEQAAETEQAVQQTAAASPLKVDVRITGTRASSQTPRRFTRLSAGIRFAPLLLLIQAEPAALGFVLGREGQLSYP